MPSAHQRSTTQRLLMAFVALLFVLQPLVGAAGSCVVRAKLFGTPCCCSNAAVSAPKSCCSKRAQRDAPAPKKCGCELNAPPLVPPSGSTEVPGFLDVLAHAFDFPIAPVHSLELAHTPARAHAPPGLATCFHALLGASMARALAFERTLRC